ncbi:MAG: hypothetical protein IKY18_01485 [Oscillospiraceae bacterium]|nr:hypothetical protein [Oscillospiraceae bacterium]
MLLKKWKEWKESPLWANILYVLFAGAILVGLLTRVVCIRDTNKYDQIQPELRFPDVITDVLHDPELGQIYVCYNDASYVNIYTEDGEFLWAVSAPYMRNVDFALMDGRLFLNSFVYDASDGTFLERLDEEIEIPYQELEEFSFDAYQVYRGGETVVSRPGWYWLTNFVVCWGIAMGSGLVYGCIIFATLIAVWWKSRKRTQIEDRKARFAIGYWKFKCALQILWAAVNVAAACYGWDITIGTIAVVLHFIVSGWVLTNIFEKVEQDEEQDNVTVFWYACDWVTVIIAFVSVIAVQVVLGNF